MANNFEYKIHVSIDQNGLKDQTKQALRDMAKEIKNNAFKIEFTGDWKDLVKQLADLQNKVPEIDVTRGIEFHLADAIKEDTELGKQLLSNLSTFVINSVKDMVTSVEGIKGAIAETSQSLDDLKKRRGELYDGKNITNATQAYEKAEQRFIDAETRLGKAGQDKTRAKAIQDMRDAYQDMANLQKEAGKDPKNSQTMQNMKARIEQQADQEFQVAKNTYVKLSDLYKQLFETKPTHNSYAEMLASIDNEILEKENRISKLNKDLEAAENPEIQVKGKLANDFIEDLQSQLDALTGIEVKVKPKIDKDVKLEVEVEGDVKPTKVSEQNANEIVSDTETAVKNFERLNNQVEKYRKAKADAHLADSDITTRYQEQGIDRISTLIRPSHETVRNNSTTQTGLKRKLDEYLSYKKAFETGTNKDDISIKVSESLLNRTLDELAAYVYSFQDANKVVELFGEKNKEVFDLVQERIELSKKAAQGEQDSVPYMEGIKWMLEDYGIDKNKITSSIKVSLGEAIETGGMEAFATKVEELFGIKIPTTVEQAKASIQSVNEAVSTPPNTSGMDKVEEEHREEAVTAQGAADAERNLAEARKQANEVKPRTATEFKKILDDDGWMFASLPTAELNNQFQEHFNKIQEQFMKGLIPDNEVIDKLNGEYDRLLESVNNPSTQSSIVSNQNEIQTEFHETAEKAKEATDAINEEKKAEGQIKTGYRAYNRVAGIKGEEGISWFSDDFETTKTYVSEHPDRNVIKGQIDTSQFFKLNAQGAKATAITYLGDQSDEASKKITEVYNKIQAIKKELAEKPSDALSEELKQLELEYDALSEDESNMYGTRSSTQFALRAKEAGYKGIEISNVIDDYNMESGKTSTTIAIFDNDALRETEDITSQIKGNIETTQQTFNKASALKSYADAYQSEEYINNTDREDLEIYLDDLEKEKLLISEVGEANRLAGASAHDLGEELRKITTQTSEEDFDYKNLVGSDDYTQGIADVFNKKTGIGKYYDYLVQNTDFGTTEEEVSAAYEQIAQKIIDFQKEVNNIVRSKIESIIGGSNQESIISDTTIPSVAEYIKKSDDEIYASGRELAKNRETVLQELAQREIDLANQVSGEKKQIYTDMANATFKMSKAGIEDGNYKIEEKISSTKNQMDLLQREIESETDPKILDGLNRELDETKIKFIALVNAFKQSGNSFSEVDALSFGSEAIDRYSRTQRENYAVGDSNYSIESESKDYWDNLTKGIKSENELAQAIEQRKQKLVELEKVRRTSEEKDIEAYKKYDSLPYGKERESAWAEYQSLSDKTNEITERYNEARLELYNLIQLQDNWGKSLENAPKINTSFLGDEWKEEEQVLYAIDDEISSIIEKSEHATQLSNKNNVSTEDTTANINAETEALEREEQQARETAEAKEAATKVGSESSASSQLEKELGLRQENVRTTDAQVEAELKRQSISSNVNPTDVNTEVNTLNQTQQSANLASEAVSHVKEEVVQTKQEISDTSTPMLDSIESEANEVSESVDDVNKKLNMLANHPFPEDKTFDNQKISAMMSLRNLEDSLPSNYTGDVKQQIDALHTELLQLTEDDGLSIWASKFKIVADNVKDVNNETKALKNNQNFNLDKSLKVKELDKYVAKLKELELYSDDTKNKIVELYNKLGSATDKSDLSIYSKELKLLQSELAEQVQIRQQTANAKKTNDTDEVQRKIQLLKLQYEYETKLAGLNPKTDASSYKIYDDAIKDIKKSVNEIILTEEQQAQVTEKTAKQRIAAEAAVANAKKKQSADIERENNRQVKSEEQAERKRTALLKRLSNLMLNGQIMKASGNQIKNFFDIVQSDGGRSIDTLNKIEKEINDIEIQAKSTGKTGQTMFQMLQQRWQSLAAYLGSFASFYRILDYSRRAITIVKEFDDALTEMRKVSDESISTLKAFQKESFNIATQVGSTAKVIQDSTADWMRLGRVKAYAPLYSNIY